jgi:hypothetical protein
MTWRWTGPLLLTVRAMLRECLLLPRRAPCARAMTPPTLQPPKLPKIIPSARMRSPLYALRRVSSACTPGRIGACLASSCFFEVLLAVSVPSFFSDDWFSRGMGSSLSALHFLGSLSYSLKKTQCSQSRNIEIPRQGVCAMRCCACFILAIYHGLMLSFCEINRESLQRFD